MKILGLDYGRKKIGVAEGETGGLARPLSTIRYDIPISAVNAIRLAVGGAGAEKIVVSISEGQMAQEEKKFAQSLRDALDNVEIVEWDETLSTHDAQVLSREAGIKRKKRSDFEDAFAAALMLQSYLDAQPKT